MQTVELSNGVVMPILGLGTSHSGGYNHEAMVHALEHTGYRLVDTARRYGTESFIGKAIHDSRVDRKALFLTSKLWPTDYGYYPTIMAAINSIQRSAMQALVDFGLVRAIGVSNFEPSDIESLVTFDSGPYPHVNQCEFHPYHDTQKLRSYCKAKSISFQGYCPLAKGAILDREPVVRIARQANRSPAQVLIRWSVQHGVVTIPKSTKIRRLDENFQVN